MTIKEAIVTYLATVTDLTALVSTRVYPDHRPQNGTLPAVVYRVISRQDDYDLARSDHVPTVRVQFDCYASTAAGADAVAEALRPALQPEAGALTDWGSLYVQDVFLDDCRDDYAPPVDGSERGVWMVSLDALISWEEPE